MLTERNPHLLFEGCLIGCWAIGAKRLHLYPRRVLPRAAGTEAEPERCTRRATAGRNIMGSGWDCESSSTAGPAPTRRARKRRSIESLEGKRAQPRSSRRFPRSRVSATARPP